MHPPTWVDGDCRETHYAKGGDEQQPLLHYHQPSTSIWRWGRRECEAKNPGVWNHILATMHPGNRPLDLWQRHGLYRVDCRAIANRHHIDANELWYEANNSALTTIGANEGERLFNEAHVCAISDADLHEEEDNTQTDESTGATIHPRFAAEVRARQLLRKRRNT